MPTSSNELFRFAVARPPSGIDATVHSLTAARVTTFETTALQAATRSQRPRLSDVAAKFIAGRDFGPPSDALLRAAAETMRQLERELIRAGTVGSDTAQQALRQSRFPQAVASAGGDKLPDRLWSRLAALHCTPASDVGELLALSQCIRALHLIGVSDDARVLTIMRAPLALPLSKIRAAYAAPPRAPAADPLQQQIVKGQKRAVQDLVTLESLVRKLDKVATSRARLKKPPPSEQPLSAAELKQLTAAERALLAQLDELDAPLNELLPTAKQALQRQATLAATAGRSGPVGMPKVLQTSDQQTQMSMVSMAQLTSTALAGVLGDLLLNFNVASDVAAGIYALPPDPELTEGLMPRIRPVGVLDLKRVDAQLNHYRLGEVAHVENVLASEFRERVHKREDTVEEILVEESQVTRESERNLETSERFELQQETSRVINEQMQVTAGVNVSVNGPSISVGINAGFTYGRSQQDAQKASSKYAKEVVEKSREKVEQRIREQRTTTRRVIVHESNTHRFDNSGADSTHKVGVYRFVDKVYDARLLNYGRRMMFEFMVPEPAAVLRNTERQTSSKPEPLPALDIQANQINAGNYQYYAGLFGAREVTPPPPRIMAVAAVLGRSNSSPPGDGSSAGPVLLSGEVAIPAGYAPVSFQIIHGSSGSSSDVVHQWGVGDTKSYTASDIHLTGESTSRSRRFASTRQVDKVPAWVLVGPTKQAVANVTVECERQEAALQAWQTDTYQKIREAFEIRLADTLEANRRLEAQQRKGLGVRNESSNRRREREELMRGCITLFNTMLLQGDYFNATTVSPGGVVMDVGEALREGQAVRFFQGAFEWDNMTYELFPYFWGKRERWGEMLLASHEDPKFEEFLRSGFARVTVPVNPGQEINVLNFLSMGLNAVFDGAREAVIDDPEYLSLLAEVDAPLEPPVQEGEPWQVVVPTTLVKLQLQGEEESLGLRGTQ